jgi:alanine racemase
MQTLPARRPTWAEIDLGRLGENFRTIKSFCGDDICYMAVIKADAYGHGAVDCGRKLEAEGADWFGVACLEEAAELRQAGISRPILVFGGAWPGQEISFLNFDLTPMVFTLEQAERMDEAAARANKFVGIHVKIDTGMNRVGFRLEDVASAARKMSELRNIRVEGLMTHFAVADTLEETEFTNEQISKFSTAVETFLQEGHRPNVVDMANSPGAVVYPLSRSKMVRIGGLLYGITDDILPDGVDRPSVQPVMSVYTKIAMIKTVPKGESIGYGRIFTTKRDSLIATVPIGYNDGYDRALSNVGEMIVRGIPVPVVGRVSMDWITIDVTDVPGVQVEDQVTVIGTDGDNRVTVEDLARKIETISYEITCGIAPRVPRLFK